MTTLGRSRGAELIRRLHDADESTESPADGGADLDAALDLATPAAAGIDVRCGRKTALAEERAR